MEMGKICVAHVYIVLHIVFLVGQKFREGRYKCLVTTDVAARGLDIPEVDLVIQIAPPKVRHQLYGIMSFLNIQ